MNLLGYNHVHAGAVPLLKAQTIKIRFTRLISGMFALQCYGHEESKLSSNFHPIPKIIIVLIDFATAIPPKGEHIRELPIPALDEWARLLNQVRSFR